MLAAARTFAILGVEAYEVSVEVDVRQGLPAFSLVGLPDAAVRESRERVRAALANSGFEFPLRRITANLAPADLRKAGPGFDLAIAAALLAASGQLPLEAIEGCALAGELALDGTVRPVAGVMAMADRARRCSVGRVAVAADNAAEALMGARGSNGSTQAPRVVPLRRLEDLTLLGGEDEPLAGADTAAAGGAPQAPELPDLADLRGQPTLRFALEVAAAGAHGLLVTGPPGSGKSLAARRLPSIMPPLAPGEAVEVLRIASVSGRTLGGARPSARRPFRAPHHTISAAGLVGGGTPPRPGEVTLAHRGILFLDELPEFKRDALEALRQPLEEGTVTLVRARHAVELPCRFLLVAAANPCPCGRGRDSGRCGCADAAVNRYAARLSGALADRIDLSLGVAQPAAEALAGPPDEDSATVRVRVEQARQRASARLGAGRANGEMSAAETRRLVRPTGAAGRLLAAAHADSRLSGRAHDRVLRVARTIADLEGCERVGVEQIERALSLRRRGDG